MNNKEKPRLEVFYKTVVVKKLFSDLKLKNIMQVPKLEKIVLNIGVKDAVADKKYLKIAKDALTLIAGQAAVATEARKSIASFKIREGLQIGVKVTLRNKNMYDFLDKFLNLVLPMIRDFRGMSKKFDNFGNYNIGIKEWIVFPELDYDTFSKIYGLNISIVMNTCKKEYSYYLLKELGMSFTK